MILLIYRTKTTTFPQCQPSKHQCFPAGKVLILLMDDRMILGTLRLFDKLGIASILYFPLKSYIYSPSCLITHENSSFFLQQILFFNVPVKE